MKNICLTIEYDGSGFCGWQRQKNGISVQELLEKAIQTVTGEQILIHGAGRTDAGVHALGQVAHFLTESRVPPLRFAPALNRLLPDTVSVRESREVPQGFHARYSAVGKHYRYLICNRDARSAIMARRAGFVLGNLDEQRMNMACNYLVGTHDFRCFMASGSRVKDSVRTLYEAGVSRDGNLVAIDLKGDGFLYNMVRIVAGTLVEVGTAERSPHDVMDILHGKDRARAGKTMPPQGLYLVEVFY